MSLMSQPTWTIVSWLTIKGSLMSDDDFVLWYLDLDGRGTITHHMQ